MALIDRSFRESNSYSGTYIMTKVKIFKSIISSNINEGTNCIIIIIIIIIIVMELKDLEIRGRVDAIQTTLLRSAGILRRVLETWGDLLLVKLQWESSS